MSEVEILRDALAKVARGANVARLGLNRDGVQHAKLVQVEAIALSALETPCEQASGWHTRARPISHTDWVEIEKGSGRRLTGRASDFSDMAWRGGYHPHENIVRFRYVPSDPVVSFHSNEEVATEVWIEHNGGPCPVDPWCLIYIKNRGGWVDGDAAGPNPAGDWQNWEWKGDVLNRHTRDIVAYRVAETKR